MNRAESSACAQALRGWLQGELGDTANVYHQRTEEPDAGADAAHRFSLSVQVGDVASLVMLRNRRGTVRGVGLAVLVMKIDLPDEIKAHGRYARRDCVVHVRGDL